MDQKESDFPGSARCPCCGGEDFRSLLALPGTPVSGILRRSPEELPAMADLSFEYCGGCGLLRSGHHLSPPDYSEKPRATTRQMPTYLPRLLSSIREAAGPSDLVAEIGANDGNFLDLLRKEGYARSYGIEPSAELARLARARGLTISEGYFGPDAVEPLLRQYGPPRLVLCRHTLEHVPDPRGFVQAIADLIRPAGGVALIEVPDSTVICDRLNFVELWDEHLYYFTPATLRWLLESAGLSVVSEAVFPHLDTQNIVMLVSAGNAPVAPQDAERRADEIRRWERFSGRFERVAREMGDAMRALPRPVHLIGASHPQCNFVNYLGIEEVVDFMIDDDPVKMGCLPPIRSTTAQIISSEAFSQGTGRGALVLTGFGYPGWTKRLRDVAIARELAVLDPRDIVEQVIAATPDSGDA